ncbi:MAG: FGGY family carbohydrate kinase, partial [Candidatus Binatia bacterium]
MREAILAVDIGTSSCRAVLFDFKRKVIVTGRRDYPFQERRPGWMEQDARSILRAFRESIQQVTLNQQAKKYHVCCLILGSALHSLLAVDGQGRPLAPLQIWGDSRARLQDFERSFNPHFLYRRTGCPFHPSYPFCKILWMREHQAGLFKKTAKFVSIKSFVLATLFKRFVEDISVASATGLLNTRSMLWDTEALALTGLNERRLPELLSPYDTVGHLGFERA